MIIYIESKAFPRRTFVVRVEEFETVARIRAQILHYLYELRREDHQFRLRYKGQYLRDSYTVKDYDIPSSSIIRMIPLTKRNESYGDLRSLSSLDSPESGHIQDIRDSLAKEVQVFDQRESIIKHFLSLQYVLFLSACLGFLTTYWYSGIWGLFLVYIGAVWSPKFTRFGGFVGKNSVHKNIFCIVYGTVALLVMAVDVYFASAEIIKIIKDGCDNAVFDGDCTHKIIYSAVYFPVNAICLFIASVFIWILFWNMKIEYGDFIEKLLVQSRDIEELVQHARSGSIKEKRIAAFELATLAATSDDNKFKIVANDGLDILTQLALSRDESTREQAVEAINEMLMIPSIQESFIEKGGITTMSALLRTNNNRLVANAASAIQTIVSETDENKVAFAERQGLQDLAYAAKRATISTQRIIAGIFLELSIHPVVRNKMTTTTQLFEALEELAQSNDPQIQRNALQTLELLAMENSDRICEREQLLYMLLDIPSQTVDENVYLSTSRILLYYAENPMTCESMLNHPHFKESMTAFAKTKEVGLQKTTIRIINFTFELPHLKEKAQSLRIEDTLNVLKKQSGEREVWDLADESLRYLNEETVLSRIPNMTPKEKIARMDFNEFGSKASLRSGPSSS